MFKPEDFDHIQKMKNSMADGMTDGSGAHQLLEGVVEILSKTDFTSDENRMNLMMSCINLCYDKDEEDDDVLIEDNVIGVILALCFNYTNIVSNLIADGFDVDSYYDFLKSEVLPVMREESKSLPYWDMNE